MLDGTGRSILDLEEMAPELSSSFKSAPFKVPQSMIILSWFMDFVTNGGRSESTVKFSLVG